MLQQTFKPLILSAYFDSDGNQFKYSVVNNGKAVNVSNIEISEHRLDAHTYNAEWTYHNDIKTIPAD
jgi:hypothetical protein